MAKFYRSCVVTPIEMGDKYEICSILYSRYGFRDFRECRYMVKVRYPNGKIHRYYYANLLDLRKLLIV